ncbi:hypothetical protein U9M48_000600 [Paspalum notatum var. saurae]|uniref:Uncharacterized protein n=1 Tax=Paspalum notatum var. saurae TaxID=547442 RepID=A0AAQ3SCG3_PASNO
MRTRRTPRARRDLTARSGSRNDRAMANRREGWWFLRWGAMEFLEQPNMEDIVETSLRWQGQADCDVVDELDDESPYAVAVRFIRSNPKTWSDPKTQEDVQATPAAGSIHQSFTISRLQTSLADNSLTFNSLWSSLDVLKQLVGHCRLQATPRQLAASITVTA